MMSATLAADPSDGDVSVGWRCGVTRFLAGPTAVIIGRVVQQTVRGTDSRLAARLAALASLGASVVHFAVVPPHWQEWAPAGIFFVAIALFQLVWARVVLVRTTTPVLAAGILFNVGAIALWALSRTAGAPVGPHAGQTEIVAGADLCALLLQIYVVMGAGWVWYRGLRGGPVSSFASAAVTMGAVGVVALASTVGAASGLRHGDHGHGEHGPGGHGPVGAEPGHHLKSVDSADDHHGQDARPVTTPPTAQLVDAPTSVPGLGSPAGATPAPISDPLPPAEPLSGHEEHDHAH